MAVSSTCCAGVFLSFECRPDPKFSSIINPYKPSSGSSNHRRTFSSATTASSFFGSSKISSLILRFPSNFVRQSSTKARRNCSNIGVAQVVAASWSNNSVDSTNPSGGVPARDAGGVGLIGDPPHSRPIGAGMGLG